MYEDELIGDPDAIAIVGMACRFPNAADLDEFWQVLLDGKSVIDTVPANDESWRAPARGRLKDIDLFDADLFGMSSREAMLTDPQHRLLLECLWEALETAGYIDGLSDCDTGLFLCEDPSNYRHLLSQRLSAAPERPQTLNHLAAKMMQIFRLKGPVTAFSGGDAATFSAIHMAQDALKQGLAKFAIVGAVSAETDQDRGYDRRRYPWSSPDGRCFAFDEDGLGPAVSSGAGVLVLRPYTDAAKDGDVIWAVLRGSSIRADARRSGPKFQPSVTAWSRLMHDAVRQARVAGLDVTLLETNGVGLAAYDGAEFEAILTVYGRTRKHVALSALKTLIGHTGAASGMAAVIKVALNMRYRTLTPSVPYRRPNTACDFENTPFNLNIESKTWWSLKPRVAGLSTFGFDGVDGHLIMQETTFKNPYRESSVREDYLLTLSADSESALEAMRRNLLKDLKRRSDDPHTLADWVYSLNVGRRSMKVRQWHIFHDRQGAIEALEADTAVNTVAKGHKPRLAFLFPAQTRHYVDLGAELYEQDPFFRNEMDLSFQTLADQLGVRGMEMVHAQEGSRLWRELLHPQHYLPILFALEYAFAKTLEGLGLEPTAVFGMGIGELVAASLNDIIQTEDALGLVHKLGTMITHQQGGRMMAVFLNVHDASRYIGEGVDLAAINGPNMVVLSGPMRAVTRTKQQLEADGVHVVMLEATHAFHSKMMNHISNVLYERADRIPLARPKIPHISGFTGEWISARDALSPDYWGRQVVRRIDFDQAIKTLDEDETTHYLEVGPGSVLRSMIKRHPDARGEAYSVMGEDPSPLRSLLKILGVHWAAGGVIDWEHFYQDETRHRQVLPTYPFQRSSCRPPS